MPVIVSPPPPPVPGTATVVVNVTLDGAPAYPCTVELNPTGDYHFGTTDAVDGRVTFTGVGAATGYSNEVLIHCASGCTGTFAATWPGGSSAGTLDGIRVYPFDTVAGGTTTVNVAITCAGVDPYDPYSSCCPDLWWCDGRGDVTAARQRPEDAAAGPWRSEAEATENCPASPHPPVTFACDGCGAVEIDRVLAVHFANKTGAAVCMPNTMYMRYDDPPFYNGANAGCTVPTGRWNLIPRVTPPGFPGFSATKVCDGYTYLVLGVCTPTGLACTGTMSWHWFNTVQQRYFEFGDADPLTTGVNNQAVLGDVCPANVGDIRGPFHGSTWSAYPGVVKDGEFDVYIQLKAS